MQFLWLRRVGDFLDINENPNSPTGESVSVDQLLSAAQLGIAATIGGQHTDGSGSMNEDPAIWVQHFYALDVSRFNLEGGDYNANWRDMYSGTHSKIWKPL